MLLRSVSSVSVGGKLFTAVFYGDNLAHIAHGKDGKRLWVTGWQVAPSKLAVRVALAFGVALKSD